MAIRVQDSFTDVAGTDLTSHTGEVGATWTRRTGGTGTVVITNANRIRHNTASTTSFFMASGQLGDEQDIVADWIYKSDINDVIGIFGRSDGPEVANTSNNYYRTYYNTNVAKHTLVLDKVVNGTVTTLQSVQVALSTAETTYRVTLQIRGAAKKVFVGTTEHLSNTDDAVPLRAYSGIYVSTGSVVPTDTTGIHHDFFEASDTAVAHPLTAAIAGTSATSATHLSLSHPLTSAISGTSATSATGIQLSHPLTAAVAGTSATSATGIALSHPLSAAISGTSSVSASLDSVASTHPLTAAIAGTSAMAASHVTLSHPLSSSIVGTSSTSAAKIVLSHPLASTISGTSATSATGLTLSHPLTSSIAGTSATTASQITLSHPLSASIAGTSGVTAASISLSHPLTASVSGASAFGAASLSLSHPLTAGLVGGSSMSGVLKGAIVQAPRFHALFVGM